MKNKVNQTIKKSIKTSKYEAKKPTKKEESLKVTFDRKDVIAESANSILVQVTPELSVWLSKRVSFASEYTNKIVSYITPSYEYNNVEAENDDDIEIEVIKGSDLYDYFI